MTGIMSYSKLQGLIALGLVDKAKLDKDFRCSLFESKNENKEIMVNIIPKAEIVRVEPSASTKEMISVDTMKMLRDFGLYNPAPIDEQKVSFTTFDSKFTNEGKTNKMLTFELGKPMSLDALLSEPQVARTEPAINEDGAIDMDGVAQPSVF